MHGHALTRRDGERLLDVGAEDGGGLGGAVAAEGVAHRADRDHDDEPEDDEHDEQLDHREPASARDGGRSHGAPVGHSAGHLSPSRQVVITSRSCESPVARRASCSYANRCEFCTVLSATCSAVIRSSLAPPARNLHHMRIAKLGVVGAGTMGSGIAALAASAGIPVVLLDVPGHRRRPERSRPRWARARPQGAPRRLHGRHPRGAHHASATSTTPSSCSATAT